MLASTIFSLVLRVFAFTIIFMIGVEVIESVV